jgi:threonine/homoserine/homoserine lactone efflux protein
VTYETFLTLVAVLGIVYAIGASYLLWSDWRESREFAREAEQILAALRKQREVTADADHGPPDDDLPV